ncbi:MAG: pentapeptide repeat-containing protein [Pirellulales bacterium]
MTKYYTVLVTATLAALFAPVPIARADIFQWEYIYPANPEFGKQQSTTLAPDGSGADAVPGANLYGRNLTMAYLIGADLNNASFSGTALTNAELSQANLTSANFSGFEYDDGYGSAFYPGADLTNANLNQANLSGANFTYATLTGASLANAQVRGTNFYRDNVGGGSGITPAQLYSTASYQARDLTGIDLSGNDLSAANLSSQNLTNAIFSTFRDYYAKANLNGANLSHSNLTNAVFAIATLTGAALNGSDVRGAAFNATIDGSGITLAQLYSTASYQARDLTGIFLHSHNLTGANFAGQNLSSASFWGATLTGANFTGAEVRGAYFSRGYDFNTGMYVGGLASAQLYSTASYQAHDLSGITLYRNNLAGVNLAGQNLTNASFRGATLADANFSQANLTNADFSISFDFVSSNLTSANLSQANLTNANFAGTKDYIDGIEHPGANLTNANLSSADSRGANFYLATLTGANTSNLIQSDGHVAGLDLSAGASLVVRDYDGNPAAYPTPTGPLPIVVEQHLAMDAAGTLRVVFDADPWDSTISFAPGIPVARGGTLELDFAPDVNVATQIGRTIDLFDWTGVTPTGAFTVSSPYTWNLSNLYTTGEVTLAAVPSLPGDFNNDGTVDAADYVVWRKGLGTTYTADDYNVWRAHFGATLGSGSGATGSASAPAAPEPTSIAILLLSVACLYIIPRRWVAAKNRG